MAVERFVLDASVALEWFLPGSRESTRYAVAILGGIERGAYIPAVPEFWHYEVASALLAAKRDKRMGAGKLKNAATRLAALQPETFAIEMRVPEVIAAGLQFHLQGYDALYFELARRLGVAIASVDGGIQTACRIHRVRLLEAE